MPSTGRPPADEKKWDAQPATRGQRIVLVAVMAAGLAIILGLALTSNRSSTEQPKTLTYSTFLSDVADGNIRSVLIDQSNGVLEGSLASGQSFTAQGPVGGPSGADLSALRAHDVTRSYVAPSSDIVGDLLEWILPVGLICLLLVWMTRSSRSRTSALGGWTKSTAKVHVTSDASTLFADIAGYDAVKDEISELVSFLKDPAQFSAVGARIPKGVLLVGPPGTGKTLLARAVAGEAGVPFLSVTGSEFMEMFVGVGAARVRDLFSTARQRKPSIIFIDEIDAIGRKRGSGIGGGQDEREQTLNQILSEMDGFDANEGIVVMAATNRPDVLDPALLRAGRFDRQVVVPLPTLEERKAILAVHCRSKRLDAGADLEVVARATPGMSGAELENLVNEAALVAVRRGSSEISHSDLEQAHDRILLGLRRTSLVLSDGEKRIVAYHESGHTLVAELLTHADPVHKVTILPTGMALGVTQQLPDREHQIEQLPVLEDALAVRLGGRAAEELVFGVPSTGAQDDLVGATELARRMVREWGMSKAMGEMAFGSQGPVFLGTDLVHTRDYSDDTARLIDEEVGRILTEQAQRTQQLLAEHRGALDALALRLYSTETLERTEIHEIIERAERTAPRPRPAHLTPVRGEALQSTGATRGERANPRRRSTPTGGSAAG